MFTVRSSFEGASTISPLSLPPPPSDDGSNVATCNFGGRLSGGPLEKKKEEKKLSATRRDNCVQGTEMVDLYSGSLPSDLICVRDDIPSFVINKVYIYMYLYVERDWTKLNSLGKGVDWKSSLVISLSPPGIESD